MRQFLISSCGLQVCVVAENLDGLVEKLITAKFWYEFIPAITIEDDLSTTVNSTLTLTRGENFEYDQQNNKIYISSERDISLVVVIVGYTLERLRQEQGQFTIHGNVIQRGNTTVAIVGGVSGLGKTTLSSYSALNGWRWLSDEKFVTDARGAVLGSVFGILNDDKTRHAAATQCPRGITSLTNLTVLVYAIVTTEAEATTFRYAIDKTAWHVYEEMSRDIRVANSVTPGISPLPSFDSPMAATKRWAAAQAIAQTVPCYFIRGNEQSILMALDTIAAQQ